MDTLRIASWGLALACLIGQAADCIITDISVKAGMAESNGLLAWAVKKRWPSYLIKIGGPIAAMIGFHYTGQYATRTYGNADLGLFAAYIFFLPGAFDGFYQAKSNWRAYKTFKAKK